MREILPPDHIAILVVLRQIPAEVRGVFLRVERKRDRLCVISRVLHPPRALMCEDERLIEVEGVDDALIRRDDEILQLVDTVVVVAADNYPPVRRELVYLADRLLPEQIPRLGAVPDKLVQKLKDEIVALSVVTL